MDTVNLDGESHLKTKQVPSVFKQMFLSSSDDDDYKQNLSSERYEHELINTLKNLKFTIQCEAPNALLYNFDATLSIEGQEGEGSENTQRRLNIDQVLLRSTSLRHCEWAVGFVVNTGKHTKVITLITLVTLVTLKSTS